MDANDAANARPAANGSPGAGNGPPHGSGGRAALFPQVLEFVQEYVRDRVDLRGLDPREIGLQTYASRLPAACSTPSRPTTHGANRRCCRG